MIFGLVRHPLRHLLQHPRVRLRCIIHRQTMTGPNPNIQPTEGNGDKAVRRPIEGKSPHEVADVEAAPGGKGPAMVLQGLDPLPTDLSRSWP